MKGEKKKKKKLYKIYFIPTESANLTAKKK